jgi:hypothetical protein
MSAVSCTHPEAQRTRLSSGRGYRCEVCRTVMFDQTQETCAAEIVGLTKPEPPTLAVHDQSLEMIIVGPSGIPSDLLVSERRFDEEAVKTHLRSMTDSEVGSVINKSTKLTDLALAELRVRFAKNGKLEGVEFGSCKTWADVLRVLDIPESTARYRIAKSGVDNPAKKHDGSENRKAASLGAIPIPEPDASEPATIIDDKENAEAQDKYTSGGRTEGLPRPTQSLPDSPPADKANWSDNAFIKECLRQIRETLRPIKSDPERFHRLAVAIAQEILGETENPEEIPGCMNIENGTDVPRSDLAAVTQ